MTSPRLCGGMFGRHADGDAGRTVDQQVREACRHDRRLHQRFVEVGVKVDGLLFDVAHHLHRQLRQARLGIAHRGGAVAVDGAKVALSFDEQVARREVLRQTHHGVVDGGIAVRVVFAEHVADDARGLAEGLVRRDAELVHGIEDAAMHGLEAVAHVGQRAADDDRHRIGNKRFFQLVLDVEGHDMTDVFVVRQGTVLRFVRYPDRRPAWRSLR